jgi:anti-sigma regulatory factor (Ser/Thr protein kinase)
MERFARRYRNKPETAAQIREAIRRFCRTCRFSEREVWDISVAVGEACANAIEHGYVPGSDIDVRCVHNDDGISIAIHDAGGGLAESQKRWERVVHKTGPGGFGFTIMRGFVDGVRLRVSAGNGASLFLRKRHSNGLTESPQSATAG